MVSKGHRLMLATLVLSTVVASGAASTAGEAPVDTAAPVKIALGGWVGTWQTAPAAGVENTPNGYPNHSIRNVVHTSIGGETARVRLSNAFGKAPLPIRATVAVAENGPKAVAGTMRELTFGGSRTITIPAGAEAVSDPVRLTVPADGDLLVTTFTPEQSGPVTYHPLAMQTSYFTRNGDFSTEESGLSFTEKTNVWHYVAGVDVHAPKVRGAVVTLGDSITDGAGSTASTNRRWPDYLADRLLARPEPLRLGVLNSGISANRVLLDGGAARMGQNALARLDRDVLTSTGARTVIMLEGINDIQQEPHQTDADQLVAGMRQVVQQAHARGLRVLGGTITPFKGWRVYNETLEATRLKVNEIIRSGKVFDGVIDFDKAIRDPQDPLKMRPEYDSGDHLHPGDAGFKAMADAIDLALL
ncbi:SGNH/GDSL hydrolase family protein [Allokutzneria albata]|uniref:Lysophospholipase L1 n=1 Tax=Allokutzneria albata TaxID=211114 RepID=A0A1G9ZQ58_ALLAB|nr:SGNH/GDSL hydrolase family protein [Allokutzneria albata]SDN23509.1 Lysophospholipase L1 [Allokutzneria albata]